MDQLVSVLRRERHLLEILLFKLVAARHLLAASELRFLPWAAQEVERAVARVREAELERAMHVSRVANELGVSLEELTLRALAEESPEPWRGIFADHRAAFLELTGEIEQVAMANRKLAGQGMRGVQEVLDMLDAGNGAGKAPDPGTYGPDAHARRAVPASVRFDGSL